MPLAKWPVGLRDKQARFERFPGQHACEGAGTSSSFSKSLLQKMTSGVDSGLAIYPPSKKQLAETKTNARRTNRDLGIQ